MNAVRTQGYHTNVQVPYEGEGGRHFTLTINGQTFGVFILWTAIGHPDAHYFSIQVSLDKGIVASLFQKAVYDERLEPACRALDTALSSVPLVSQIQWLTHEQFKNIE